MFTKFGIWEKEVLAFVDNVCSKTQISSSALTGWMKSQGVLLFQKEQARLRKGRDVATEEGYAADTLNSFRSLLPKLIQAFAKNDTHSSDVITDQLDVLASASALHKEFYGVQAEIANSVPKDKSRRDQFDFVVSKFEEAKVAHPALADAVDNHLLLMNEYIKYMKSQAGKVSSVSVFSSATNKATQHDLMQSGEASLIKGDNSQLSNGM